MSTSEIVTVTPVTTVSSSSFAGNSAIGFTVPDRVIMNKGSKKGVLAVMHLEEVRDVLKQITERQDSKDMTRSLNQLHVSFNNGIMQAGFLTPRGVPEEMMLVSEHGAQMLADEVIPKNGFKFLRHMAQTDVAGEKLASLSWAWAARTATTPRMVRTTNMKFGSDVHRVIRSVHSPTYASYSNYEFVQDILDNAEQYRNLPVVEFKLMDSAMRLRFAGNEDASAISLREPIPMVEAWNSEVGRRRVGLRAGMWKLICTNGMGSWNQKSEYNWIHRGNSKRISDGVGSAFADILTEANGVVESYQRALLTSIDSVALFIEKTIGEFLTGEQLIKAQNALNHSTATTHDTLAAAVDAVTLIAQDESSMFDQYELEKLAASMMRKGTEMAGSSHHIVVDD